MNRAVEGCLGVALVSWAFATFSDHPGARGVWGFGLLVSAVLCGVFIGWELKGR